MDNSSDSSSVFHRRELSLGDMVYSTDGKAGTLLWYWPRYHIERRYGWCTAAPYGGKMAILWEGDEDVTLVERPDDVRIVQYDRRIST